jgi:Recombination endonuclease VII
MSKYGIPLWMAHHITERMAPRNPCPACGTPFGPPGSTFGACIDHDHDTGLVRMIVCGQCNTSRLRNFDDGRNTDALLLAAGRNAQRGQGRGRKDRARALIQLRLAALLIEHYAPCSPLVAKALSIPLP